MKSRHVDLNQPLSQIFWINLSFTLYFKSKSCKFHNGASWYLDDMMAQVFKPMIILISCIYDKA